MCHYFWHDRSKAVFNQELSIRYFALGQKFWGWWNIADIGLVLLCLLSLALSLGILCGPKKSAEEALGDSIMVLRNGMQFTRLAFMTYRNANRTRSRRVDLNMVAGHGDMLSQDHDVRINLYEEEDDDFV